MRNNIFFLFTRSLSTEFEPSILPPFFKILTSWRLTFKQPADLPSADLTPYVRRRWWHSWWWWPQSGLWGHGGCWPGRGRAARRRTAGRSRGKNLLEVMRFFGFPLSGHGRISFRNPLQIVEMIELPLRIVDMIKFPLQIGDMIELMWFFWFFPKRIMGMIELILFSFFSVYK